MSDFIPRHKYEDIVRCWRADLLDHHITYQHGEQPDFDVTRQR